MKEYVARAAVVLGIIAFVSYVRWIAIKQAQGEFDAVVQEVRITGVLSVETPDSGMSPGEGAVIGGLVASTPGAIVGAILTDDSGSKIRVTERFSCAFVAETKDGRKVVSRHTEYDYSRNACSLLRKGDRVRLRSTGSPMSFDQNVWVH